jgi:hypothetical protein
MPATMSGVLRIIAESTIAARYWICFSAFLAGHASGGPVDDQKALQPSLFGWGSGHVPPRRAAQTTQ